MNYNIKLRCTNCGARWSMELPKGKRTSEEYVECPTCGCSSYIDTVTGNIIRDEEA